MNILFLNNYHYLRGGSEQVYFGEIELLRTHGHLVHAFARKTESDFPSKYAPFFPKDIKTDSLSFGFSTFRMVKEILYSSESKKQLEKILKKFKPDVVHAHNIYGRLTTSVLDLLYANNIPIVMTLHDYKLICPSYKMMFNNRVCEDCKGGKYYQAVLNKCHKNSMAASAIYALETWLNDYFQKYRLNVSFFVAPSLFLKDKLVDFGWVSEQVIYIPNYIVSKVFEPNYDSKDYLLYLGRLSAEKGISTLIQAFLEVESKSIKLVIAGDGPERGYLESISKNDNRIKFTGYLSGNELREVTRNAKAVVIPSEWYENAPISILEAFAYGKPVIGARIGGIPEMVVDGKNGLLFESGNVRDLTAKIRDFLTLSDSRITDIGKAARKTVEEKYNPELHYDNLFTLYQKAIDMKEGSK
ncbi:MAG: glycosyltransferase family 4 protein [Desulfamplus sp.]|nr:glycosyltransferase family 4 protein [Desulfamplus sp.]